MGLCWEWKKATSLAKPMGTVVEVGSSVTKLNKGDRVVVPFVIACGHCFFCTKELYSWCETRILTQKKRAS
jgi:threonine dehydrogenase-like Zn-dependent dehydrogenase